MKIKEVGLTKKKIRSKILLVLKKQKEEDRRQKSRFIKEKLFKTKEFKSAKRIMFYISFDGEVDTEEMIDEARKLGKIVAVPVCKGRGMIRPCLFLKDTRLKRGPYGIPEPAIKRFIDSKSLNLVIVPAVAFTREGKRLGRGKGYYDNFLGKLKKYHIPTIGLAFDFQILPYLPTTKQDVSVERVIYA
ncbi:MAG: 5-formyltetrahydrofolate cyclo-ligase [Candidatus Omnitrophica bacterium]|nr:5-formyltetrahydrofolate cyclo-ligase [Candidatus Omnitrophota bacterium]